MKMMYLLLICFYHYDILVFHYLILLILLDLTMSKDNWIHQFQ